MKIMVHSVTRKKFEAFVIRADSAISPVIASRLGVTAARLYQDGFGYIGGDMQCLCTY